MLRNWWGLFFILGHWIEREKWGQRSTILLKHVFNMLWCEFTRHQARCLVTPHPIDCSFRHQVHLKDTFFHFDFAAFLFHLYQDFLLVGPNHLPNETRMHHWLISAWRSSCNSVNFICPTKLLVHVKGGRNNSIRILSCVTKPLMETMNLCR